MFRMHFFPSSTISLTTPGPYPGLRAGLVSLPLGEKTREAEEPSGRLCSLLLLLLLLLPALPLLTHESLGQSPSKEQSASRTELWAVVRQRERERRPLFHGVTLSKGCYSHSGPQFLCASGPVKRDRHSRTHTRTPQGQGASNLKPQTSVFPQEPLPPKQGSPLTDLVQGQLRVPPQGE